MFNTKKVLVLLTSTFCLFKHIYKDINMMKKHYDEKYFIEMCRLVTITQNN